MLRKVMHLVRTVGLIHEMKAVVEATGEQDLKAVAPADLWSLLLRQGVIATLDQEEDQGVEVFFGEYDPAKHSELAVVDLPASPATYTPTDSLQDHYSNVSASRNAIVVKLTRTLERYEVIRIVAQMANVELAERVDATELWNSCCAGGVPIEEDESVLVDYELDYQPISPAEADSLPVVTLTEIVSERAETASLGDGTTWVARSSPTEKDVLESMRVRDLTHPEANYCNVNARKVLRSLPDYADADYVEGFMVTEQGACIEHGWIVKDGKIIDPTLPDDDGDYFPALTFAGRDGIRNFLSTELGRRVSSRPFHQAFGWNPGLECGQFLESFRAAMRHVLKEFGQSGVDLARDVRNMKKLPWTDEW